jgi:hypothetical protein
MSQVFRIGEIRPLARPGSLMLDDTGRSHQSSRTKADIPD